MDLMQHLGLALPIFQAPMAGAQGCAMAIAVSEAGGLGALTAIAIALPWAPAIGAWRIGRARPRCCIRSIGAP